jgi:hypothetical protein
MTVATFNQTDYTAQDSASYKANIDADINVLAKLADLFAPHQSNAANMTITLDAGRIQTDRGNAANKAAQVSPTMTAPTGGNNRIDIVVVDANGNAAVVTGTPAPSPSPPTDIGGGNRAIAQILLSTGMNHILNGNITDMRSLMLPNGPMFSYTSWNMANASGNQAVPVGFRPSTVILIASPTGNNTVSFGLDNGTDHYCAYASNVSAWTISTGYSIMNQPSTANTARALIGSKNATGFNLTWDKVGTPSGNTTIIYLAFP